MGERVLTCGSESQRAPEEVAFQLRPAGRAADTTGGVQLQKSAWGPSMERQHRAMGQTQVEEAGEEETAGLSGIGGWEQWGHLFQLRDRGMVRGWFWSWAA